MTENQASPRAEPTPTSAARVARGALGWQLALSVLLTIIVIALVWRDRAWLSSALGLVRSADLLLVGSALAMILLSYLVSSQIFRVGLRAYGRRVSVIRLWATTITGVVISQSFPAGGVGTYAFFVSSFKAIGIDAHQAAALAALEALSYVGALLLIGMFSIVYLAAHTIGGEAALSLAGPLSAVVVAAVVLGGAVFAITRSEATLTRLAVGVTRGVQRALRRPQSDATGQALAATLVRGRELIVSHRGTALTMVLIQVVALIGHSLGLLLALRSLHAVAPFPIVLTALGIGLMTSTFNVLPGGGGTVETALVAVLLHFGVGDAAAPGAILFRLLDFWAMLPLAIVCYGWLRRARR